MKIGNIFIVMFFFVNINNSGIYGMQYFGWFSSKSYGYGVLKHGKEKLKDIFHNGSVTLDGTTVSGSIQVNGSFDAQKAVIAKLDINGSVAIDDCTIEEEATVNGSVKSKNSRFRRLLSIASEQVYFDASVLHELKIRKVGGFTGVQVVELHNGTKINGPISFESGNGEVLLDATSEVSRVSGGKVLRK